MQKAQKSRDSQVPTQKSKSNSGITSHAGENDNSNVLTRGTPFVLLQPLETTSMQLNNGTKINKNSVSLINDITETNSDDQTNRTCKNTLYSQKGRLCKPNSK